jgi:raffinose/stachyose/melibiose transport system permease protein
MHKVLSNKKAIFLMVFPGMAFLMFALVIPVFYSIVLGMTNWNGYGALHFIGIKNFTDVLFHDPVFWISLRNALLLALCTMLLQHPIALLFAYMIAKVGGRREKLFRTIFFVPCVLSVVVISRMWVSILNPTFGLVAQILNSLHLGFLNQDWLGDPRFAIFGLIFIIMWQGIGWATLIYYAGVKGLSGEIMEAAKVDGASGFKLLVNITLPLLKPVITVNLTLALISCLKQMEIVFLTTGGGPGTVTQFIANYLYQQAFNASRYGYANAISVIFVVVCIISTLLLNKILKKDSDEN